MSKNEYMEGATYSLSADKIYQKIADLEKDGKKEEYKKRWLWELTQNAKDCAKGNEGISINIVIQDRTIGFSHDGYPFDYNSVMDLVLQNSSKRKADNKTGKFGTGFISTHFISKKVSITGNYIDNYNNVRSGLNIVVDRNFSNVEELEAKLRNTIEKIDNFFSDQNSTIICSPPYETAFNYEFSNTDVNLINDSIKEFYEILSKLANQIGVSFNEMYESNFKDMKRIILKRIYKSNL